MPGIAGLLTEQRPAEGEPLLQAMLDSMMHESCFVHASQVHPSHGWFCGSVAIAESYADGMPVTNETSDVALFLAGECLDAGRTASGAGRRDPRPSPKELVSLYEEDGPQFLRKLNGWFSGVIVDSKRARVVLFNDRHGLQKIYYHQDAGTFAFASEAKALLRVMPALRAIDQRSIAEYLCFDCVLGNHSYFSGVNVLPGGSVWVYSHGTVEKTTYFDPAALVDGPALRVEEFKHELARTFESAVQRQLAGESLAIALTGGTDTRLIMSCLPADRSNLTGLTFGGMYRDSRDVRLARRVAQACGIGHTVLRLGPEFLAQYSRHAPRGVYISDGQADATNLDAVYLNNRAREVAPIKLTGTFGSQVLGRVRRALRYRPPDAALVALEFRPHVEAASRALDAFRDEHDLSYILKREIPWYWSRFTVSQMSQLTLRSPFLDNDFVELLYRAPREGFDGDEFERWAISQRNPRLLEIPTSKGAGSNGLPVISAVAGVLSRTLWMAEKALNWDVLPHSLHHPVTRLESLILSPLHLDRLLLGFEYYRHYNLWFRRELASYLLDTLLDERTLSRPYWNAHFLKEMVKNHVSGRRRHLSEIRKVLTVELVHRVFIDEDKTWPAPRGSARAALEAAQ